MADEKFKPTTSISGSARRAENNVIVLPEPGGPHNTENSRKIKNFQKSNKISYIKTIYPKAYALQAKYIKVIHVELYQVLEQQYQV